MLAPVQCVLGKAPRRLIPNAGHSLLNVCMASRRVQTLRLAPEILYSLDPAFLPHSLHLLTLFCIRLSGHLTTAPTTLLTVKLLDSAHPGPSAWGGVRTSQNKISPQVNSDLVVEKS